MKIETKWDKSGRPTNPRRGELEHDDVVDAPWGKRPRKPKEESAGSAVRFCKGTKRNCDVGPKSKVEVAEPQRSRVSTSQFDRYGDKARGAGKGRAGELTNAAMKRICSNASPTSCTAQVGYSNGRRVIRFCTAAGKPGHVVDIHGKSPDTVRKLAQSACKTYLKQRGSYAGHEVGEAALGGVKRRVTKRRKPAAATRKPARRGFRMAGDR